MYSCGPLSSKVHKILASPVFISFLFATSSAFFLFIFNGAELFIFPYIPKKVFLFISPIDVPFSILPFISPGFPFSPFTIETILLVTSSPFPISISLLVSTSNIP